MAVKNSYDEVEKNLEVVIIEQNKSIAPYLIQANET